MVHCRTLEPNGLAVVVVGLESVGRVGKGWGCSQCCETSWLQVQREGATGRVQMTVQNSDKWRDPCVQGIEDTYNIGHVTKGESVLFFFASSGAGGDVGADEMGVSVKKESTIDGGDDRKTIKSEGQ